MRGDKQVSRRDGKGEKERRGLNQEEDRGEKKTRRGEERWFLAMQVLEFPAVGRGPG